MAVSFSNDIMPLFYEFKSQMMWRFDLTNYEHVVNNAQVIYSRISDPTALMPPPPKTPLTPEQVQLFKQWMDGGFQP